MIEVKGKYNNALVYTTELEDSSKRQIENLCNQEFTKNEKIRMMPDVHAGAGCTIGTTMTISDKIVPNLVGVDIGCGMETLVIKADSVVSKSFNPAYLDKIIKMNIPSGHDKRKVAHKFNEKVDLSQIRCPKANRRNAELSLGTLGGGNHFIEADRDDEGNLYIVIHSGSRHLGLEIADYYQNEAWNQLNKNRKIDVDSVIQKLKEENRESEIENTLKEMKSQVLTNIPPELAYCEGDLFDDYIHDMKITQEFALWNRKAMMDSISIGLHIKKHDILEQFTTIHNYIDTENMILRKGSVSAQKGEKLLIPINMRDGSLVCIGKGNADWNYSAPHGAGRVLGRREAKRTLSLEEFKAQMSGIYSSTVNLDTIDEAPMAYKNMNEIIANIEPTAEIVKIIKPIFNFKSPE